MPRRRPNAELRRREHLTEAEVERLIEVAKGNRWGLRDATMVLVAYRHGLRFCSDNRDHLKSTKAAAKQTEA
jgi:integrase